MSDATSLQTISLQEISNGWVERHLSLLSPNGLIILRIAAGNPVSLKRIIKAFFGEFISDIVQRYDAYRLTQVFKGRIRHFLKDASIKELIKKGKPYIDDSYKGDPVLSMGKVIEYVEEGFDGIVNVIPFHCMPGTVVNGLLERFQRDYYGMPCLKLSFDGQEQTNEETRLEAFMHQAYQRMEGRLNSKNAAW